jgi:hypothetical protein
MEARFTSVVTSLWLASVVPGWTLNSDRCIQNYRQVSGYRLGRPPPAERSEFGARRGLRLSFTAASWPRSTSGFRGGDPRPSGWCIIPERLTDPTQAELPEG